MAERLTDQERVKVLLEEFNRRALSDGLTSYEVATIRELLPQIRELLESKRRSQWLWKRIGVFLLAAPAVGVVLQGAIKLLDWLRSQ
jgi:transposase